MTYHGPLFDPPPDDMPPSGFKDHLAKIHEQDRRILEVMGAGLSAHLLWELLKGNHQSLEEYERVRSYE